MKTPPEQQLVMLCEFRKRHHYQHLKFSNWSWPYLSAGSGPQTVLLLPGALVGAEMWLHVIMALEDRYRLLALDIPSKALSLPETIAALTKLLEVESVERAIVVGYSAGGGLAQAFTQAHPERVAHLVLSHCTALSPAAAHRLKSLINLLRLLPAPLIRTIMLARSSHNRSKSDWAAFTRTFFAERIVRLEKAGFLQFFESGVEAARAFCFEPGALQNWSGKILLASSRDDAISFPRLGELQARYPNALTHVFDRGGHHTILVFPDSYVSMLANFLA